MLRDNQLCTVLLLAALGFLIYNLVNCDSTENFAETKPEAKSEAKPEAKTEAKPEMKTQQVMVEQPKETKPAATQQEVSLFDFQGNDSSMDGAALDSAFERPIAKDAKPDAVDMQKNNVKKYDAKDFLPKEINSEWFDTDFSQAKNNVKDEKLINTEKYVIGINTVGQSLKNASYDIRGTVANPKFSISPWNNSTYEPDFNLKSLC